MLKAGHTCSWKKVVPVFVEGHSHDAVSQVKGFLDAVTMVNIYVNVQNPRVVSVTHTHIQSRKEGNRHRNQIMMSIQRSVSLLE